MTQKKLGSQGYRHFRVVKKCISNILCKSSHNANPHPTLPIQTAHDNRSDITDQQDNYFYSLCVTANSRKKVVKDSAGGFHHLGHLSLTCQLLCFHPWDSKCSEDHYVSREGWE